VPGQNNVRLALCPALAHLLEGIAQRDRVRLYCKQWFAH
jgi:hypothetical protein